MEYNTAHFWSNRFAAGEGITLHSDHVNAFFCSWALTLKLAMNCWWTMCLLEILYLFKCLSCCFVLKRSPFWLEINQTVSSPLPLSLQWLILFNSNSSKFINRLEYLYWWREWNCFVCITLFFSVLAACYCAINNFESKDIRSGWKYFK